jgi:ankyrin repeat protein
MPKIKTFDPDEFLFDLFAMRVSEVQEMFWGEINKDKPHLEKIKIIIDSGLVDVKAKDDMGWTPLLLASRWNHIEIAKLLLDRGADVKAKDNWGDTPLHRASRYNRIEIVGLLLEKGADMGAKNRWGQTPLHLASENNNIEIAKLLLDAGADVEAKDNDGWTPLHWASARNYIEIAKLLLERGADPWAEDSANKIPKIPYDYAKEKLKPLLREYMKKPFAKKKNIV